MNSGDGKKTLLHTFKWKVQNIGSRGGLVVQADIDVLYKRINDCNVCWSGAKHHNRLRRSTNVYVAEGELMEQHGTVVGHVPGFSILNDPRLSHRIRILLASGCIEEVRQNYVRLVDLHMLLPLGIPKPLVKKRPRTSGGVQSKGGEKKTK